MFLKAYWLKKTVESQRKVKHYHLTIMVLTPHQRAFLRAKKAIANGDTNFKPRGEKNKAAFEALKEQAQQHQNPLLKRIKIAEAALSHAFVPTGSSDDNRHTSDKGEEHDDVLFCGDQDS